MSKYYIVWNADRTEGFITDSQSDADGAANNHPAFLRGGSTAGIAFREAYEDDKRTVQEVEIHKPLSANARKLLKRVEEGRFYLTDTNDTPKAMQELLDHGLVTTMGRVTRLERCYVVTGHTPFVTDKAPGER